MPTQILDALRRGDTVAALTLARQSVVDAPERAELHHALALCLQRNGDGAAALEAAKQAIVLAPTIAHYHTTLAALAVDAGQLEQGRDAAAAAVSNNPNHLPGYAALVHLALARADLEDAERNLKLGQRVDAEHSRILVAQAQVHQFKGEADAALKVLTQAVLADPEDATAQATLGLTYLDRGQDAFAEQALRNAMALLPDRGALRWPLLASLRRQGKGDELLDELDALLTVSPDDAEALSWRAGLLGQVGQIDRMLADLDRLTHQRLHNGRSISWVMQLLAGSAPEALGRDWLERKLVKAPDSVPLWHARLAMAASQDERGDLLLRWESSAPGNAARLSWMAVTAESQGQVFEAEQLADACIALEEVSLDAHLVKLRAGIRRREPALAQHLARLDELFSQAATRDALAEWRPLALDALGRFDEAARAMLDSPRRRQSPTPLPRPRPAADSGLPSGDGVVLWGAPGSRIERVVDGLAHALGPRLLQDRVLGGGRGDGHDALLRIGERQFSNDERQARIATMGANPAEAIDWLPHWDAATAASLRGARLWAVLRDPRDQLLNWLACGTRVGYRFVSPDVAAEWMAQVMGMLADHSQSGASEVSLLRTDGLDVDGETLATQLGELTGQGEALPFAVAGPSRRMIGGLPADFPEGHWRQYRSAFGQAFDRLSAVALRLGYPAD